MNIKEISIIESLVHTKVICLYLVCFNHHIWLNLVMVEATMLK